MTCDVTSAAQPLTVEVAAQVNVTDAGPIDTATVYAYINAHGINETRTSNFFADYGARLNKMSDRLFIAAASDNDGNKTNVAKDWLSNYSWGGNYWTSWAVPRSHVAAVSDKGVVAFVGASRTSDLDSTFMGTSQISIGFAAFAIADHTSQSYTAYGYYGEGICNAGATGVAFAMELDSINYNAPGFSSPYHQLNLGSATALWLASGGQRTVGVQDSLQAIGITKNGAKFKTGISFGATAITGTDGVTGYGEAIAMAKGHWMAWYTPPDGTYPNGAMGSYISSAVTSPTQAISMQFWNNAVMFLGPNGSDVQFVISCVPGTTSYLTPAAGQTGGIPILYAMGAAADIDLGLGPKGNGKLSINSPTTNSAAAGSASALPALPKGYLTISINAVTVKVPYYA